MKRSKVLSQLSVWLWAIIPALLALVVVYDGSVLSQSAQRASPPDRRADPATFLPGTLDPTAVVAARTFTEFPILWLGEEFQGLKLTKFIREKTPHPSDLKGYPRDLSRNTVSLLYGSCVEQQSGDGSSCVIPLSIIIWAPGSGPRPDEIGDAEWRAQLGPPDNIRGLISRNVGGSPLIWADNGVTITVHANGADRAQALQSLQLANALPVGLPEIGPGESLAPLKR